MAKPLVLTWAQAPSRDAGASHPAEHLAVTTLGGTGAPPRGPVEITVPPGATGTIARLTFAKCFGQQVSFF